MRLPFPTVFQIRMSLHNNSQSQTLLTLSEGACAFQSRVQSLSLIEEWPALDLDGDGLLSRAECEAGKGVIVEALALGYRFGSEGKGLEAVQALSIEPQSRTLDGFGFPTLQEIVVEWRGLLPGLRGETGSLPLAIEHFQRTSPGHQDRLIYRWSTGIAQVQVRTAGDVSHPLVWEFDGPVPWSAAFLQSTWQGGAGLALVLALVNWWQRRALAGGWLKAGSGLCLSAALASCIQVLWGPFHGDTVWFLPLALGYILADSKLGGRWMGSLAALVVWGLAFGYGFGDGAGWGQGINPIERAGCVWGGAALVFALAFGVQRFWKRGAGTWAPRLAWIALIGVGLNRLLSTFG